MEVIRRYSNQDRLLGRLRGLTSGPTGIPPDPERPRPKRVRRLTSGEVDDLLALHATGVMINDLAVVFGISRTTVMSDLDRAGVERRTGIIERHLEQAEQLYASGWSLAKVGKHFNVNAGTVWRAFRRAGVPMRPRSGW